jgi:hypothetical protein
VVQDSHEDRQVTHADANQADFRTLRTAPKQPNVSLNQELRPILKQHYQTQVREYNRHFRWGSKVDLRGVTSRDLRSREAEKSRTESGKEEDGFEVFLVPAPPWGVRYMVSDRDVKYKGVDTKARK